MPWREKATLGEEIVCAVHDILRIDDAFLTEHALGFDYWAGDLATHVVTDLGIFRGSQSVYKVTAETDLVKGRGHMREIALALEHDMDTCSFSGPVYVAESDTFKLYCGVYAVSDHSHWMTKTFAAAVALQISEAFEMSRSFRLRFGAVPATSGHPTAGLRSVADAALTHAPGMFHPSGDRESRWIGDSRWEQAGWVMEREALSHSTSDNSRLDATFGWPCGNGALELAIRTDEPHPKLGNGLHLTLSVPMNLSIEQIGHLVLELNTFEKNEYRRCHTLGSWCEHKGTLAHRLFFPNALYDADLLEEAAVSMVTRAIWTGEWFAERQREAQLSRGGM